MQYATRVTSMGPRSFERGNNSSWALFKRVPLTSMGPRSFERGNVIDEMSKATQGELQWGRARSSAETPPGRRFSCEGRDFNGAALVRARKQQLLITDLYLIGTSMGPRSFERGNLAEPFIISAGGPTSMGPRSFERGNINHWKTAVATHSLQWGRARSSAETGRRRRRFYSI